jgi:hypothetical protein
LHHELFDHNLIRQNQPQELVDLLLCQAVQRWQQVPGLNSLGVVHPTLAIGATPENAQFKTDHACGLAKI